MKRIAIVLMVIQACVAGSPPDRAAAPEQDRITVNAPTGVAYERVIAAFLDEGLTVDRGDRDGGIVVSVPVRAGGMVRGDFVYRATIVRGSDSSRVVLQVLMRCADCQALSQAMAGVDPGDPGWKPITSRWGGEGSKAWNRLVRLAVSLKPFMRER